MLLSYHFDTINVKDWQIFAYTNSLFIISHRWLSTQKHPRIDGDSEYVGLEMKVRACWPAGTASGTDDGSCWDCVADMNVWIYSI